MITQIKKTTRSSSIVILLLISLLFIQLTSVTAAVSTRVKPVVQARVSTQTPCQQQKNAQNHATKLCPESSSQFATILPDILRTLISLAEKASFLFILGLLAMCPVKRIFKPPRFQFAL
jgi:hypothetical protein